MKKTQIIAVILLVIIIVGSLVSCKKEEPKKESIYPKDEVVALTPEALGKEIFEGKGNCISCHQVDKKVIGPSIQEIAKIYKEQNGDIISFLKEEGKPIVDASQYEVMKTNFVLTKAMSDEELKALEAYFYSHLK
jgi:cytochrome c